MPLGSLVNPLDGGAGPTTGQIAGGVLYGLNGQTITGNSSGAWAIAANGTNQSITLTPSGSGFNILNGGAAVGTNTLSSALLAIGTNTTTSAGGMVFGTDFYLYRTGAGGFAFDSTNPTLNLRHSGSNVSQWFYDGADNYLSTVTGRWIIRTGGTTAFIVDSSQNILTRGMTVGTSGVGVIAIANGTAPSSSPAGGGQLYVESGALKYRGSSGTVTTLGVA